MVGFGALTVGLIESLRFWCAPGIYVSALLQGVQLCLGLGWGDVDPCPMAMGKRAWIDDEGLSHHLCDSGFMDVTSQTGKGHVGVNKVGEGFAAGVKA